MTDASSIKDILRKEIAARSIRIMSNHGADDREIKKTILKSFSIDEETCDTLMRDAGK